MTSLDVASVATSPRPARKILSRTREWSGGIVEFPIPRRAKAGSFGEGDNRIAFLKFAFEVKGGLVNFFVHSEDVSLINKKVTAFLEVHRKVFEDGGEFLHIDLIPTEGVPTHWLQVQKTQSVDHPKSMTVIRTPLPLQGEILISLHHNFKPGPVEKVLAPKHVGVNRSSQKQQTASVPVPVKKKILHRTGDAQLDTLLNGGWSIAYDGGTEVHLTKTKMGEIKRHTHYRSKT